MYQLLTSTDIDLTTPSSSLQSQPLSNCSALTGLQGGFAHLRLRLAFRLTSQGMDSLCHIASVVTCVRLSDGITEIRP